MKKLYVLCETPLHVQAHMKKVAEVAVGLGRKIKKQGIPVDLMLVKNGALLHDAMKAKFGYRSDRDVAALAKLLRKMGEKKLATLISKQYFSVIVTKKLKTIEEKIVYYADKRVLHDKVVSLKKRLEDGKKRYFPDGKLPPYESKAEKKIFRLEKELRSLCH